ncbi:hypothetical protein HPB50_025836 [Hyalomma asiaticum]|uniref:Uncharacterized protein n=1 Tax=Hyalomma asiaticum TaxID=266040 RepID=A0ACB7SRF2_HYAAI|nr:hypothetical protein HPB50_025836 [Hyalomma asiaticum]
MAFAQKLAASVANNISALVFGQRYELEDPRCHYIEGLVTKFLRYGSILSVLDFLPTVRAVCSYIPNTRMFIAKDVMKKMKEAIRRVLQTEVKNREKCMEDYFERDFVDGYMRKMDENKDMNSHFSLRHLEGNAINLYGAATNTVRTAILWNLYIAASDPDGMQSRVQREIDSVIGREKPVVWEDRHRLPYTMASVLETLRWRTTAPIGIHRVAMSDTKVCGYDISAGTFVIANLWSVHNDPAYWRNPREYDPTRFLKSDGTELAEKPQAFLPFSEEIQCFVNHLASAEGEPMAFAQKLAASVANNISALVSGKRYDLQDPRCHYIEGLVTKFLRYGSVLSVLDFLPTVRSVCSYIPNTRLCILKQVMKEMKEAIRRVLQ